MFETAEEKKKERWNKLACQHMLDSYLLCSYWLDWMGLNVIKCEYGISDGFDLLKYGKICFFVKIVWLITLWIDSRAVRIFYNIINGHWCQVFLLLLLSFSGTSYRSSNIIIIPSEKETHTNTNTFRSVFAVVFSRDMWQAFTLNVQL